jgi:hypothetical protein
MPELVKHRLQVCHSLFSLCGVDLDESFGLDVLDLQFEIKHLSEDFVKLLVHLVNQLLLLSEQLFFADLDPLVKRARPVADI